MWTAFNEGPGWDWKELGDSSTSLWADRLHGRLTAIIKRQWEND